VNGMLMFEKVKSRESLSELDPDMVQVFLQSGVNRLTDMHVLKKREFKQKFQDEYNWCELKSLRDKFKNKQYSAFILSKKPKTQTEDEDYKYNRIEKAIFTFDKYLQVSCKSIHPGRSIIYSGSINFDLSLNKAIIQLQKKHFATYQIIIEFNNTDDFSVLTAVYSGISQNNEIVAGRVIFIEDESLGSEPELITINGDEKYYSLIKKHSVIREYLAGRNDHHLDDTSLFNPSKNYPYYIQSAENNLENFPGIYHYYRTRTIKGHIREIKKYPILIKSDGEINVKVQSDGEIYMATGKALRKNNRVYLHLLKKDKYDGLAIIYPRWNALKITEQNSVLIPGVYTSTSKKSNLMCGRLIFSKYSSSESLDDLLNLIPENLKIDSVMKNLEYSAVEKKIAKSLAGQIDNYIAVRHPNEVEPLNLGQAIFDSACKNGNEGNLDEAFRLFMLAILNAGYRDISQIKAEFAKGQSLHPLIPLIQNQISSYNFEYREEEDEYDYLVYLMQEVHPPFNV
jgi:hypothetical protein